MCSTFLADAARRRPCLPAEVAALPAARLGRHADDHGRARHGHRAVPRLPAGSPSRRAHRPQLALLRRAARGDRLLLPRRARRRCARTGCSTRLDLAFSRDQRQKVYVQDRMLEHGVELWRWLQDGAHFYVCGDASRMAQDVDDTLTTIARRHGGLSEDAAAEFKKTLVAREALRARRVLSHDLCRRGAPDAASVPHRARSIAPAHSSRVAETRRRSACASACLDHSRISGAGRSAHESGPHRGMPAHEEADRTLRGCQRTRKRTAP